MKIRLIALYTLFFCSGVCLLNAQSVADLEGRLRRATSKPDKLALSYQLAEKLLSSDPGKAANYALQAAQLATELSDRRKETSALLLSADGLYRSRNLREAANRYSQAWQSARNYGHRDAAMTATERLQDIYLKQNDYKTALDWSIKTVNYLKENGGGGRGGGEAVRRLEDRLSSVENDNRNLREQLAKATGQSQILETTYRQTEAQLKEAQEKSQQALTESSQFKARADQLSTQYADLSKEQLKDSVILAQQERELERQKKVIAEAEVARQAAEISNQNVQSQRNLAAIMSLLVLVLAGAFYLRYRAKRRAANELSRKNVQIEEERKRSDNLLLNILPPAIAQELKVKSKVAAHKYEKATVMFIDFKGFTRVAEKLSPERLVEELDFCFSNFDRIIGHYRIEKIKTIGDAYMCASGLSDMNASPSDIIRAGLEIQDFLLGVKAERMGEGLPYFEARIGVHVGPVVAGVVGAKKFAYDIWGDTVNIAARMEEACETGRVNVSEDAYWLAKYEFEWIYRGKIAAKNKGEMDMYYVKSVKES
jgi:class 3 adenylate cyclase